VPLVARAGEFSLHHTHLLHSSAPNHGRDRRIGVGISYIPTRVPHVGPRRLTASLVRGHDRYGHVDPEPRPRADFDAEARAAHAEACERLHHLPSRLARAQRLRDEGKVLDRAPSSKPPTVPDRL